jgi:ubiquinone/menaquinone biosynthesis C-methylase UbiE
MVEMNDGQSAGGATMTKGFQMILNVINFFCVPIRLMIPQPLLAKLPVLRTNEQERRYRTLKEYQGRALDIGCGSNVIVKSYRSEGGEGIGVDVYEWDGPDLIVPDTAHLPYESGDFDTISFVACLNHIPNRMDVLKEAYRLLKSDGRVLITNLTPLISQIWHTIAFWDSDQHERGMKEGEVWGFTDADLREMLDQTGFECVKRISFMWGLNHLYICKQK